jgi:hypothetical protein
MIGKFIRFWPLITAFFTIALAWGALAESVREHHRVDDLRCQEFRIQMDSNNQRIAKLEQAMIDIADMKNDIREIRNRYIPR